MEFSTPLVQIRWFVSQHPRLGKSHPVYMVNGILMTICFVACRLYPMIPHNIWAIWVAAPHAADLPMVVRVAASFLWLPNLLNLYWGWLMVKGLGGVLFPFMKGGTEKDGCGSKAQDKKVAFSSLPPPPPPPPAAAAAPNAGKNKALKVA